MLAPLRRVDIDNDDKTHSSKRPAVVRWKSTFRADQMLPPPAPRAHRAPAALGVLRAVHSASLRMDAAMGRWRALTRAATRRRREQRPPDPARTTGTRDPAQCPLECPQHAAWACTHDHHRHYAVTAIPIATGCERFTRWRGIALFSSFIVVSATNSPELIFAALGGQRPVRSALSAHTDHCEF